jgi:group I intron endonuclease
MLPEIYLHFCETSGKSYVGQTVVGVGERWNHGNGYRECRVMERAIKKHGKDSFHTFILANAANQEQLDNLERLWIIVLNTSAPNGYNLKSGGGNGRHHADTRARISASHIGLRHTIESRQKMREGNKGRTHWVGKKHTPEARARQRASHLGLKQSPETVARRVAKNIGKKRTPEQIARALEGRYGTRHTS